MGMIIMITIIDDIMNQSKRGMEWEEWMDGWTRGELKIDRGSYCTVQHLTNKFNI